MLLWDTGSTHIENARARWLVLMVKGCGQKNEEWWYHGDEHCTLTYRGPGPGLNLFTLHMRLLMSPMAMIANIWWTQQIPASLSGWQTSTKLQLQGALCNHQQGCPRVQIFPGDLHESPMGRLVDSRSAGSLRFPISHGSGPDESIHRWICHCLLTSWPSLGMSCFVVLESVVTFCVCLWRFIFRVHEGLPGSSSIRRILRGILKACHRSTGIMNLSTQHSEGFMVLCRLLRSWEHEVRRGWRVFCISMEHISALVRSGGAG